MKILSIAAAALAALSLPLAAADGPATKANVTKVTLHDCGETGQQVQVGKPRVQLKAGVRFGCKITMEGSPKGAVAEFRAVVFRPDEMKVAGNQKYEIGATGGYVGLTLPPSSLVPGEWRLEIYVGERKMAEQKFEMVTGS